MRRCPRCHSTMLIDYDNSFGTWQTLWKCLGCGREIVQEAKPAPAADQEQAAERVTKESRTRA